MNLAGKIESLLFVASRPMSFRKMAELLGVEVGEVKAAVEELKKEYNTEQRGIQLAQHAGSIQLVTSALNAKVVADFLKEERSGELTRPALETLTIIAYRGPLPKAEIDMIRGVNCALILRHLLIRGLISGREERERMATVYEISFDFLRHLGLRDVRELPEYEQLHSDQRLEQILRPSPPAQPPTEASTHVSAETTRTSADTSESPKDMTT